MKHAFSWRIAAAVAVVAMAHAIPLAVSYARHRDFFVGAARSERIYLARIVDAYRGGSLGNPYLAGHEDAPRYMPEMVERSIALLAHGLHVSPLNGIAISRVLFAAVVALLVALLARALALSEAAAVLAALLTTLGAPQDVFLLADRHAIVYPRYFRAVSPSSHVMLLLLALLAVAYLWRNPKKWTAVWAGLAMGALFATPVYYWSVAIAGTAWLAWRAAPSTRAFLLVALAISGVFAIPYGWHMAKMAQDVDVQETLQRYSLMTPGRQPDPGALPVFLTGLVFLALAYGALKSWPERVFVMPFMAAATMFVMQNAVTNRHLQAHHWVNSLIPLWMLGVCAWLDRPRWFRTPLLFPVLQAAVTVVALAAITVSSLRAESERPQVYPLQRMMPATIHWLQNNTAPGSVILSAQPFAAELVLFTNNRVYWCELSDQHVISEAESSARASTTLLWRPESNWRPEYRADYFLGTEGDCAPGGSYLYRNAQEHTCIVAIHS